MLFLFYILHNPCYSTHYIAQVQGEIILIFGLFLLRFAQDLHFGNFLILGIA